MTKKHFIALADAIREHNRTQPEFPFGAPHLDRLAGLCLDSNSRFNKTRWLGYIAGTNGKNGGKSQRQVTADTRHWRQWRARQTQTQTKKGKNENRQTDTRIARSS